MFYLIFYLLIGIANICLPAVGKMYLASILSFSLFNFIYIISPIYKKFYLSKPARDTLLLFAIILGFIAFLNVRRISEPEILLLSWYLIFSIQIAIILTPESPRAWLSLYLLSILQMVIAGEFTENLGFIFFFLLFLSLLPFGLIYLLPKLEINKDIFKYLRHKFDLLKWVTLSIINIFFLTSFIFLILPRTKNPLLKFQRETKVTRIITKGIPSFQEIAEPKVKFKFSKTLPLGITSEIKKKEGLLLAVETDKPRLFRAKAFNHFENGQWNSVNIESRKLEAINGNISLEPIYLEKTLLEQLSPDKFIHQRFYIKNYGDNLIPGSYQVLKLLRLPAPVVIVDSLENLYLKNTFTQNSSYDVISIEKDFPSDYLRSFPREYPEEIKKMYLQLPPQLDKRIFKLTMEILKNVPPNPYDEIAVLREYLIKNYKYSQINIPGPDRLSQFLFNKKEGDCEYFATALAIMLRVVNIPTRLVIGFSGGDFDPKNNLSLIYPKHTHAWVEIYFPEIGWLPCDTVPQTNYTKVWNDLPKVAIPKPPIISLAQQPKQEELFQEKPSLKPELEEEAPEEKIPEEETPQEQLPEEAPLEEEITQEQPPEEELPEEETPQEQLPEEAPSEEEITQEQPPEEETAPKGLPQEKASEEEIAQEKPAEEKVQKTGFLKRRFKSILAIFDWILKFSNQTQKLLFKKIGNSIFIIILFLKRILINFIQHFKNQRLFYTISLSYISLLTLSFIFVFKMVRKKTERKKIAKLLPRKPLTKEEKKITNFYFYILHLLEKAGYRRPPSLTPREFGYQIFKRGLKISKELFYLTEIFYKTSFGKMEITPVELKEVEKSVNLIKEWIKGIHS